MGNTQRQKFHICCNMFVSPNTLRLMWRQERKEWHGNNLTFLYKGLGASSTTIFTLCVSAVIGQHRPWLQWTITQYTKSIVWYCVRYIRKWTSKTFLFGHVLKKSTHLLLGAWSLILVHIRVTPIDMSKGFKFCIF